MDRESKSSLDNPATKKKPPKLKAINRSISMAIDNYTPAPQMIIDDSLILEEPPLPPPPALAPTPPAPLLPLPLSKFPQPDIYLVSGAGSTSPIKYDDWHPMKKPLFRRSDTIDIHPSSTLQMKKTHSFHANDPTMEQIMLTTATGSASSSRRTSSVRGNYLFPQTSSKEISRSPSPSRRGCRTHRSFNDPSRRPSVKTEADAIRHPSLNDDILESSRPAPLFSTTNLSLENELFVSGGSGNRSRSNSHTKIDEQRLSFEETTIAGSSSNISSRKHHARQHSSHSLELEKQHEAQQHHNHHLLPSASISPSQQQPGPSHAYHFKRGGKHTHSLYLSPNNLDELQIHRPPTVQQGATKKPHSASVRVRTYREALSASKKSKSFMGDAYPDFDLSPHRRNSRPLATVSGDIGPGGVTLDEIKRSPRPLIASTSARLAEDKRPSFERKSSLSYEIGEAAAFDQVLRPFRYPMRRSSITGSAHKLKKKSLSDETDEDEESDRKRKRIVCIIMTVFLCLVCASVFVVIITLTHSSVTQVQNTTKKIYTFSRETPVHYTVRQENERLMQESMNRARFAKNFTDAASLSAAAEQIP